MNIKPFNKNNTADCLVIFDSNLDKFFDASEREEFLKFLDGLSKFDDYFVGFLGDKVVTCGGFRLNGSKAALTWGMVHRRFHGQGIGKSITEYRLSKLKANKAVKLVSIETSQYTEGFYKKFDFVPVKFTQNGFGRGLHCIAMELRFF